MTSVAAVRRSSSGRALAQEAVGWTSVGVLAVGGASMFSQRVLGLGPSGCALRRALGVPCPTCGLSTVVAKVAHLDVVGALRVDAVAVVLLAVVGVLAAAQLTQVFVRPVRLPSTPLVWIVPLGLLVAHWALTLSGVVPLVPVS